MNVLHIFAKSPKEGAETPIYLASSTDVAGVSGQYFIDKKEVSSSSESYDPITAARLWNISEELCSLGTSAVRLGDLQIAGHRLNDEVVER